ncbi:MAG: methyltransferase domain-containing protein, partial [Proteobacteria bacterium]|nr:methyltransferase domain-containing protein [Pseudomonadota bacterium]
ELRGWTGDETVLDIGPGDGSFTVDRLGAFAGGRVIGVDKSPQMVHAALEYKNKAKAPARFDFFVGDISADVAALMQRIDELIGPRKPLDVIFSSSTFHHIYSWEGLRQALRNCCDLLLRANPEKPGLMLLSFAGQGNFETLVSCAEAVRKQDEWQPYFQTWSGYPLLLPSAERMREELELAGFDTEHGSVELVPLNTVLDSSDQLKRWCRACLRSYGAQWQGAFAEKELEQREREALHTKFIEQVVGHYLESIAPRADGKISFPVVNLEIAVRPHSAARVGDFLDGQSLGLEKEARLISFLEAVSNLPEVLAYKPRAQELLQVSPGMTVLDAGAGAGNDSAWILEELSGTGRLVALDRNPVRVDYIRRKFGNSTVLAAQ